MSSVKANRSPLIAAGLLFGTALYAAEKPRVFVTESGAPALSGSAAVGETKGKLDFAGGTSSYNIKVMEAFSQGCPDAIVTSDREKAQYVLRLDHEEINPTSLFVPPNKVAVFDGNKDLIYSGTTRTLRSAVKEACGAILKSGRNRT